MKEIAKGQERVAKVGAWSLLAIGVLLFAAGTASMLLTERLPIEGLLCSQVLGLACLLLGLKKVRDQRSSSG